MSETRKLWLKFEPVIKKLRAAPSGSHCQLIPRENGPRPEHIKRYKSGEYNKVIS